jgi:hypothetical protein
MLNTYINKYKGKQKGKNYSCLKDVHNVLLTRHPGHSALQFQHLPLSALNVAAAQAGKQ